MDTIKILLVDDEPDILTLLKEALIQENFMVFTSRDGENAIKMLAEQDFDLIILDIELGAYTGWDICKIAKESEKNFDTPIIMITAKYINTDDIVKGLDIGADDYVTKPFKLNVLIARINAVLRRKNPTPQSNKMKPVIELKHLKILSEQHQFFIDGSEQIFTPKEFSIITFLCLNPNIVLERSYIMEKIWGQDYIGSPRAIDKHIENIRKKLGKYSAYIETIEGIGYKFIEKD